MVEFVILYHVSHFTLWQSSVCCTLSSECNYSPTLTSWSTALHPAETTGGNQLFEKTEQVKQTKELKLTQNYSFCMAQSKKINKTLVPSCQFGSFLKLTNASLVFWSFSSALQQQMTPSSPTVTAVPSRLGWMLMTGTAWPSGLVLAGRAKAVCFLRHAASSRALDSCSMYAHRSPFIITTTKKKRTLTWQESGKMYLIDFMFHEKRLEGAAHPWNLSFAQTVNLLK